MIKKTRKKPIFIIAAILGIVGIVFFISNAFTQQANSVVLDISLSSDNYDAATKTFTDISGYDNHGVSVNNAVFSKGQYGKVDGALSFNGVSDYIDLSHVETSTLTNATVSFWRKSIDSTRWLLLRGQTNSHYLMAVNTGNFYHAGVGTNVKIYEDGQMVSRDTRDGKWHHYVATGVDLSGWSTITLNNYSSWQYKGLLESIRIYNYSLSIEEIQSLYRGEKSIASGSNLSKGLVGHWSMGQNTYVEGTTNISNFDTTFESFSLGTNGGYISQLGDGAVLEVSSDKYRQGQKSLKVMRGTGQRFYRHFDLPLGSWVTYSAWIYSETPSSYLRLELYGGDYTWNGVNSTTHTGSGWERLSVTFPSQLTSNTRGYYFIYSTELNNVIYIDDVQIELKNHATPYTSGTRMGRLTDFSPHGNHGNSGTEQSFIFTEDRLSKESGAMIFDGIGVGFNLGNGEDIRTNNKDFSVSLWAKYDEGNTDLSSIINKSTVVNRSGWNININNNSVRFQYSDTSTMNDQTISIPVDTEGNWIHIVMVVNKSNNVLKGYVNNEHVGTYDISGINDASDISNLYLGGNGSLAYPRFFKGALDNVRIYNRALSESEIKSLYDSYNPKTITSSLQKGLVLDMPLKSNYTKSETPGSEIMTDRTPYSNDGQNYGSVVTEEGASFDGINDHVNIGNPVDIQTKNKSFSINFWVKTVENIALFVYKGTGTGRTGWGVYKSSTLRFQYSDTIDNWDQALQVPFANSAEWNHICMIVDKESNILKGYLNGELEGALDITGINDISDSRNLYLGYGATEYYRLNGEMSNFMMHDRVLSDGEVKMLYDRGRSDAGILFQPQN